ncbi:MAG: GntR family transcriptional regulator [Ectothiorhodospiraceae bacterium]|nr:GntR family transcriptional regulator [Ectothiorhodospiraceae bacterium]
MKIERDQLSLRCRVADALRAEIASGRLTPNTRLIEQKLCTALGVSRTVLREALRQLEAEGVVEIVPHRGAMVASPGPAEAMHIYEVREALESLAARSFCDNSTTGAIEELRQVLEVLERVPSNTSVEANVLALKERFYRILLDGCGNPVIRETLDRLNNRISYLRSMSMRQPGRLAETIRELQGLVDALARRDAHGASVAAGQHVRNAARNALQTLQSMQQPQSPLDRKESNSDG